jgi:hypothetical protein
MEEVPFIELEKLTFGSPDEINYTTLRREDTHQTITSETTRMDEISK